MDPISKKQLQYEEDGNEGSQKIQCDGGEATLTIAEGEMIGEDDDYNELYGDINIGEGLQFQVSEAQGPSANGVENDVIDEDEMYNELYGDLNIKEGFLQFHLSEAPYSSVNGAMKTGVDPSDMLARVANEYVPLLDRNTIVQFGAAQMPPNHSNDKVNVNHQIIANDNPIRSNGDNGATMLLVGELHWWTTDAQIESVSSKYGTVKEIKFFDEKATGKSKGYCQVEFYDSAAAAACKEGMNGYKLNGRACTVEFASPDTLWQMAASYMKKSQVQPQSRYEPERRSMNDKAGRWGGARYPHEDSGRDNGKESIVLRGTALPGGRGRGYADLTGPAARKIMAASYMKKSQVQPQSRYEPERRSMNDKAGRWGGARYPHEDSGSDNGKESIVLKGTALPGGRGRGYADLTGPAARKIPAASYMKKSQVQPRSRYELERRSMNDKAGRWGGARYPNEDSGRDYAKESRVMRGTALPGGRGPDYADFTGPAAREIPHVNSSIFGRAMSANRMGMMECANGAHSRMLNNTNMGKWGAEEHGQRPRESSYGREEEGSEYRYGESYDVSREKEPASEHDCPGNSNKRHRDERDHGRDRYNRERHNREHRYREEKDDYHVNHRKYRDWDYKEYWDQGQASSRYRSRSRDMGVDHRSRLRDAYYGKRSSYHRTQAF